METGEKAIMPALRSTIGALKYIAHCIPKKSKLLLANGLVMSRVIYLVAMWGGLTKGDSSEDPETAE